LALDFDGVICNSIHDSLLTSINAFIEVVPDHHLPPGTPLDKRTVYSFEESNGEFFTNFSRLMPLGNFAQDYYVILRLIENNLAETIRSQENFDRYKADLSQSVLSSYQDIFYRIRYAWQKEDPEGWAEILVPFPGVVDAIHTLSRVFNCAIATSKDQTSVDMLLKKWGLTALFPPENILDKDFAPSKRDHLVRFHELHGTPYSRMYFIDDKVHHLLSVRDLGVHAYLAKWGFNTPREHAHAQQQGIGLLTLEEFPGLPEDLD
jgi:phosphoglycolate phosphatase-like HAD superfamily hydrolase